MELFLVAVDRQALPFWSATQGEALVALEPEVGEHVRIAQLTLAPRESPFARFLMPVELRFAARAPGAEAFAGLTGLARRHAAGAVMILQMRRHARFHAERFEAWRATQTWTGDAQRMLCVALSDEEGYAGVSYEPSSRLFPPGMWQVGTAAKLTDAVRLMQVRGIWPRFAGTWIELGAFPGGMTRILLQRGVEQVVAIDRNSPNEFLAGEARVTYLRGEAGSAELPRRAQGLVCDVNGPAEVALQAAVRAAACLGDGAVVLHTIKLRSWSDADFEVAQATARFAQVEVRCVAVRHLPASRQELAWLGVKQRA